MVMISQVIAQVSVGLFLDTKMVIVQLVMENIKEKLFLGYGKIIVNFLEMSMVINSHY